MHFQNVLYFGARLLAHFGQQRPQLRLRGAQIAQLRIEIAVLVCHVLPADVQVVHAGRQRL